ncbi:unnamed protein product [Victoria cruziana]
MAFLQFYVKHRYMRQGRSVMEANWSSAFSYDYRTQSLSSLVSLVSDAVSEGTDISPALVDVMCANVCHHVRKLVRQWAVVVGSAVRRIPIVADIDVEEEEVGELRRQHDGINDRGSGGSGEGGDFLKSRPLSRRLREPHFGNWQELPCFWSGSFFFGSGSKSNDPRLTIDHVLATPEDVS